MNEYTEVRKQELGRVRFFLYYRLLFPIGALIIALSSKSSGQQFSGLDTTDPDVRRDAGAKMVQGFLLFNLIPAALIASVGIALSWSLAPTLYFSALGFVAALTGSVVVMILMFREFFRAAKSQQRRRQEELRGS